MSEKRTALRRIFQFSLAGLLLLALWFAGSAAGYRNGYRSGYLHGEQQRESAKPFFAKYSLYDKLPATYDPMLPDYTTFQPILNQLQENADPDSWLPAGGVGEIVTDPRSAEIVVYTTKDTHEKIVEILAAMPNRRNLNQSSSTGSEGDGSEALSHFGRGPSN